MERSGAYLSGEALANALGVSRAAVWKAVKTLQKEGYAVDAVTHRGYCLTEENDILSAEILSAKLEGTEVLYYPTIDSTNTEAKRLIASGKDGEFLVTAGEQTAGRGRQGKQFYSPALTGIYMSLVLRPNRPLGSTVSITTAAAVAVCRAVESLTDKKPQIKWVNDVYLDGKKICGILTEAVTDFETQTVTSLVIGIGVNIHTVSFPSEVENADCLGAPVRRADLIAAITKELLKISSSPFSDFMEDYRRRSMILGQEIYFIENNVPTPAKAVAINEHGGLEVALADGSRKTLSSGEISIRRRN